MCYLLEVGDLRFDREVLLVYSDTQNGCVFDPAVIYSK